MGIHFRCPCWWQKVKIIQRSVRLDNGVERWVGLVVDAAETEFHPLHNANLSPWREDGRDTYYAYNIAQQQQWKLLLICVIFPTHSIDCARAESFQHSPKIQGFGLFK